MAWRDEVEQELQRGRDALRDGNTGKVRTCARRAAGIALRELPQDSSRAGGGLDHVQQLRALASDTSKPPLVREAASRLHQRLGQDFSSASSDPLGDAAQIIDYVQSMKTASGTS